MEDYLQVGILSSTHGVHGEMKVFPTTDDVTRFKKKKDYLLETGKGLMEVHVESAKFFKQFVILKFKEFHNIDEILPYKGARLLVTRANAIPCAENENFIADLIDLEVRTDEGEVLGRVTDVLQTGANDVYVVSSESGKEYLIPVIRDCVLDVKVEEGYILIHVLEGLLDI